MEQISTTLRLVVAQFTESDFHYQLASFSMRGLRSEMFFISCNCYYINSFIIMIIMIMIIIINYIVNIKIIIIFIFFEGQEIISFLNYWQMSPLIIEVF